MKQYFKDPQVKKNILTGSVLIIILICCLQISSIFGIIKKIFSIFSPFIVGCAIAFILNVPMRALEKHLFKKAKYQTEKWAKRRRIIALLVTIVATLLVITLVLYAVIPQLSHTVSLLVKQIPTGLDNASKTITNIFSKVGPLGDFASSFTEDWNTYITKAIDYVENSSGDILNGGVKAVSGLLSGITNFIIGFIFAIYVLMQKEVLFQQFLKVLYAFSDRRKADRTLDILSLSHKTFASFVSGQCLEALILGTLFLISMSIMQLPYALLISMFITVCALIPIVGSFMGCAFGVLLILMDSPTKALIFLIWFLILQQIEGNLIYPHVVGSSVGLPGIWVLVSVTIGGALFGVVGMLIFIPLVSVIYSLFRYEVNNRLFDKKIDIQTEYDSTTPEISNITFGEDMPVTNANELAKVREVEVSQDTSEKDNKNKAAKVTKNKN